MVLEGVRKRRRTPRRHPHWARWRSRWSASTQAIIASPTGTARMPTQGSCRPCVETSVSAASRVIVRRGVRIEARGLDHEANQDRLAGGDAAEHAAGVVGEERRLPAFHADFVAVLVPAHGCGSEAGADLDALDRVDADHAGSEVGVDLAVDGRAQACRHAVGLHLDDGAERGAGRPGRVERLLPGRHGLGIGAEKGVARGLRPVPARAVDGDSADLDDGAPDRHACTQDLLRDGAGGHARRGLPRAGPSAAPVIADAVLRVVGEVGMARAIDVLDRAVVAAARVFVLDHQCDGRAGGLALEHAGEDAHGVGFAPLGHEAGRAGPAAVERGLDIGLGERNTRRHAIDDAADGRPVALAPGGDAQEQAEAVAGHGGARRA